MKSSDVYVPFPFPSAVLPAAFSVASDVSQVVSPGAYTWNVTAPVAPTAPLNVATSWILSPTVTGPEATVEIVGPAGLTVELSFVSLHGVLTAEFFASPAKKARQR